MQLFGLELTFGWFIYIIINEWLCCIIQLVLLSYIFFSISTHSFSFILSFLLVFPPYKLILIWHYLNYKSSVQQLVSSLYLNFLHGKFLFHYDGNFCFIYRKNDIKLLSCTFNKVLICYLTLIKLLSFFCNFILSDLIDEKGTYAKVRLNSICCHQYTTAYAQQ